MSEPLNDRNLFRREPHALPIGWTWKWQDDIFDIQGGRQPPASQFEDGLLPGYVRLVQIRDYYSDSHKTYVPDTRSLSKCTEHDVMIARYGASLGRICRGIVGAYNVALAKAAPADGVENGFLYYLLQTDYFQAPVHGQGARSAQSGFNREGLKSILLPLPPAAEQQAISELLGALDDKIAANTKLVATSDMLSHTVFRSMGRTDSQLIPLSAMARFVNGRAFTKDASGTGRVVIRIAELNSGIGASTVYNDIEVGDQHVARPGDLLFAWSGTLTLNRWFRPEGIVNQHIFKVIPNNGYPHWLIYELLRHKLDEFKSIAADKATTMGHIQRKHLDELVAAPSLGEISNNDQLMTALWQRALAAEVENLQLVTTRDALLPQLMSGKLQVKTAEKVLENAGV